LINLTDKTALHLQANLPEMLIAFLVFKGIHYVLKREYLVNYRAHAIGIDGFDHVLLLAAIADYQTLQAQLLNQGGDDGHLPGLPRLSFTQDNDTHFH
jgi:hypothetical protein